MAGKGKAGCKTKRKGGGGAAPGMARGAGGAAAFALPGYASGGAPMPYMIDPNDRHAAVNRYGEGAADLVRQFDVDDAQLARHMADFNREQQAALAGRVNEFNRKQQTRDPRTRLTSWQKERVGKEAADIQAWSAAIAGAGGAAPALTDSATTGRPAAGAAGPAPSGPGPAPAPRRPELPDLLEPVKPGIGAGLDFSQPGVSRSLKPSAAYSTSSLGGLSLADGGAVPRRNGGLPTGGMWDPKAQEEAYRAQMGRGSEVGRHDLGRERVDQMIGDLLSESRSKRQAPAFRGERGMASGGAVGARVDMRDGGPVPYQGRPGVDRVPARLASGPARLDANPKAQEFVLPADSVSALGVRAGAPAGQENAAGLAVLEAWRERTHDPRAVAARKQGQGEVGKGEGPGYASGNPDVEEFLWQEREKAMTIAHPAAVEYGSNYGVDRRPLGPADPEVGRARADEQVARARAEARTKIFDETMQRTPQDVVLAEGGQIDQLREQEDGLSDLDKSAGFKMHPSSVGTSDPSSSTGWRNEVPVPSPRAAAETPDKVPRRYPRVWGVDRPEGRAPDAYEGGGGYSPSSIPPSKGAEFQQAGTAQAEETAKRNAAEAAKSDAGKRRLEDAQAVGGGSAYVAAPTPGLDPAVWPEGVAPRLALAGDYDPWTGTARPAPAAAPTTPDPRTAGTGAGPAVDPATLPGRAGIDPTRAPTPEPFKRSSASYDQIDSLPGGVYRNTVGADGQGEYGLAIFSDRPAGATRAGFERDLAVHGAGVGGAHDFYDGVDVRNLSGPEFAAFREARRGENFRTLAGNEAVRQWRETPADQSTFHHQGGRGPMPEAVGRALAPSPPVRGSTAFAVQADAAAQGRKFETDKAAAEHYSASVEAGREEAKAREAALSDWRKQYEGALSRAADAGAETMGGAALDKDARAWGMKEGAAVAEELMAYGVKVDPNALAGLAIQAALRRKSRAQAEEAVAAMGGLKPGAKGYEEAVAKVIEDSETEARSVFNPLFPRRG